MGVVTACGPGQADTRPRGMSWGGWSTGEELSGHC